MTNDVRTTPYDALRMADDLQAITFANPQAGPAPVPHSLLTMVIMELRRLKVACDKHSEADMLGETERAELERLRGTQSEITPTSHGSAAVTPDPLRTVSAAASAIPDAELLLDNAATASQVSELLRNDDGEETVLREAVRRGVYEPLAKLLRMHSATTVRSVIDRIIRDLDGEGRASVIAAWGDPAQQPTIRKWLDEWATKNASDSSSKVQP